MMALEIPKCPCSYLALTAALALAHCNVGTKLVRSKSLGSLKIANKGCALDPLVCIAIANCGVLGEPGGF